VGVFIVELTMHIPLKYKYLIRYDGLCSSRTKGKTIKDGRLEKFWYNYAPKKKQDHTPNPEMETILNKASKQSWAPYIKTVKIKEKGVICIPL